MMRTPTGRLGNATRDAEAPHLLHGGAALAGVALALRIAAVPRYILVAAAVSSLMALAVARPGWYCVALIGSVLCPYTWSPTLTGGATPPIVLMAVPGGVMAGYALVMNGRVRPNRIDLVVVGLFGSVFISGVMTGHGHRLFLEFAKAGLVPYLLFRMIFAAWPSPARVVPEGM